MAIIKYKYIISTRFEWENTTGFAADSVAIAIDVP